MKKYKEPVNVIGVRNSSFVVLKEVKYKILQIIYIILQTGYKNVYYFWVRNEKGSRYIYNWYLRYFLLRL